MFYKIYTHFVFEIAIVFVAITVFFSTGQAQKSSAKEQHRPTNFHRLIEKKEKRHNDKLFPVLSQKNKPSGQYHLNKNNFIDAQSSTPLDSVQLSFLQRYSSLSIPSYDDTYGLSADASGNIFVIGVSQSSTGQTEQWLVKYNAEGMYQWNNEIITNESQDGLFSILIAGENGSVYVCAEAVEDDDPYDLSFLKIVKYSSEGLILWDTTYNSGEFTAEFVSDIARDNNGNIIISGEVLDDDEGTYSFLTLKISSSGIFHWIAQYDSTSSNWGGHTYITLDDTGNIYVAGSSIVEDSSGNSKKAIATRKLDAATGQTIWQRHYIRENMQNYAFAREIVRDNEGNIITVGITDRDTTSHDFTTIKYSGNGELLWAQIYADSTRSEYEYCNDVVVDNNGSIYTTGSWMDEQETMQGIQTLKYSTSGNLLWKRKYILQESYVISLSQKILTDNNSNIYCIGTSLSQTASDGTNYSIVKYDSNGTQLWNREFFVPVHEHFSDFTFDNTGNLIYAFTDYSDSTSEDFRTVKITPNDGNVVWSKTKNNTYYSEDHPIAFRKDSFGNIFILADNGNHGLICIKYDNAGNQLWDIKDISKIPLQMDVDEDGNSFILSRHKDSLGHYYTTTKVNAQGVVQWNAKYYARWDLPFNYPEDAKVRTDNFGNAYVIGTEVVEDDQNFFVLKYNAQGTQEWVTHYSYPITNSYDRFLGMNILTNQKIVITSTSSFHDTLGYNKIVTTLCYNSSGNQLWVNHYSENNFELQFTAIDLKVDDSANVFVLIKSLTTPSPYGYAVVQYDSGGNLMQTVKSDTSLGNILDVEILLVDVAGNMYIGRAYSDYPNYYFAIDKYNSVGNFEWTTNYIPEEQRCYLNSGTVDNFGNCYFTVNHFIGQINNVNYNKFSTVKVSSGGEILWDAKFLENNWSFANGVLTDENNNVFVVGKDRASLVLLKYIQTNVSVSESDNLPLAFSLSQNFPNPFNPTTVITFTLPHESFVSLSLYNILGEKVATLLSEKKTAGKYRAEWNASHFASGMYFYRLDAGEFSVTKKLLLIK